VVFLLLSHCPRLVPKSTQRPADKIEVADLRALEVEAYAGAVKLGCRAFCRARLLATGR
jgi:hypothetical protein